MTSSYDTIGRGYSRYRVPEPRIMAAITRSLADAETVVNVGAGTGSYEPEDRAVLAVEPSDEMVRQRPRGLSTPIRASAEALPLFDQSFDAALAVLTVHHWNDPRGGLRELSRVARRVVVFTFDPEIHNDFWLWREYVPAALKLPTMHPPSAAEIAAILGADRIEPIPIPHDCRDGFGWAYWRRPDAYLDPAVRRCISCLAALSTQDLEPGIERLREHIHTGRWAEDHRYLLEQHEMDGGFRLIVRD